MFSFLDNPQGAATLNQPVSIGSTTSTIDENASPDGGSGTSSAPIIQDSGTLNAKQKKCSFSIYQITGPAHIPTTDIRWQELFLSYDILVHLDRGHISSSSSSSSSSNSSTTSMMDQVCKSMAKHARNSSNLACFSWHLTKMMNEFIHGVKECCASAASSANATATTNTAGGTIPTSSSQSQNANASGIVSNGNGEINTNTNTNTNNGASSTPAAAAGGNAMTARITMVGKARVVCGALNLFRILCHEVITASFVDDADADAEQSSPQERTSSYEFLHEAFTYKSRQKDVGMDFDTSSQLVSTLLSFISMVGAGGGNVERGESSNAAGSNATMDLLRTVPELYDATVLCLLLLNVLFSTQLYQPLLSSFELREDFQQNGASASASGNVSGNTSTTYKKNFFLDIVMHQAFENRLKMNSKYQQRQNNSCHTWTPQSILASCLHWMIERPAPPERSIASHFRDMVLTVARDVKGEKVGPDGMYENHAIVMASAPVVDEAKGGSGGGAEGSGGGSSRPSNSGRSLTRRRSTPNMLYDATNKVVRLSSSLLFLPFRLMILALRAIGDSQHYLLGSSKGLSGEGFDHAKLAQLQAAYGMGGGGGNDSVASPTNDVLWLSDSPVADLGSTIFLILSNNYRASSPTDSSDLDNGAATDHHFINNAFRSDLASLDDNRWDGWNSSYSLNGNAFLNETTNAFESVDLNNNNGSADINPGPNMKQKRLLTTNFEHLFQSFGKTLHNELGALTLYTLLQSSPIFAASLAVRSDLDMLVIPLLRTLYYSSSINQHIAGRTTAASTKTTPSGEKITNSSSTVAVSENPFRSQSQLYVIMILLLIFSQDTSFGPDSFRRSNIPVVTWYKERNLKNISLGSLIVLSLLRCISFNLNRMQDPFLLSNCCAVLLNLSPHIVNIHSYAAMRLASVLVSSMKRYTVLVMKNGGRAAKEGDVSSVLGMYAEVRFKNIPFPYGEFLFSFCNLNK